MQAFTTLTAAAAPLPIVNMDTDKIIPARHLKTIKYSDPRGERGEGSDLHRGSGEAGGPPLDRQRVFTFEVDPFRKHCLLNGLDDIGLTMQKSRKIDAFEAKQRAAQPWLYREVA
jgi:3-isopropylmalate dehydratase small subunit